MAINNWRYVVTWGYMDPNGKIVEETQWEPWRYVVTWWYMNPNGKIVEETQWVPAKTTPSISSTNTTSTKGKGTEDLFSFTPANISSFAPTSNSTTTSSNYFPKAEVYWLQSQWYANQWDTAMANAYWNIANSLWKYSNFANTSLNNYDALLNYVQQNESWLQSTAWKLYNELVGDIQSQRDYVNQMFWPNGELTKEVNEYYDDLGDYLSTDAGRQAANIAAQWVHSWASLWAIRAQQNEAYNQSFQRYVQAKEQQINAKQQLASQLINFMSALRQEYWDTTNQYVIDLYKRANDMYNNIAQSAAQDMETYNKLRIQVPSTKSNSTTQDTEYTYVRDNNWNLVLAKKDSDWNLTPVYGPTTNQYYDISLNKRWTNWTGNFIAVW